MKHHSISIRKDDNPKISYYENIDGKISRKAKDNFGKKLAEDIILKDAIICQKAPLVDRK